MRADGKVLVGSSLAGRQLGGNHIVRLNVDSTPDSDEVFSSRNGEYTPDEMNNRS